MNRSFLIYGSFGLILLLSLAAYQYFSRTVNVTVEKIKEKEVSVIKSHKETITTKDPTGKETTKVTEDTVTDTTKTQTDTSKSKVVEVPKKSGHIAALIGVKAYNDLQAVYGLSVSKDIAGPLTLGIWGFTDGRIGISIGVSF